MEFNEVLFAESQKFRKQYPELVNLWIDIDEYLISIFNSTYSNKYNQSLLRFINAFRRNFLLASFLFESKQWNVWVQAHRTMIESWELACIYLFAPESVYADILSSWWKPVLDELVKKYANQAINWFNDESIKEKAKSIFENKKILNNSWLTHVHPVNNLLFASGFDFSVDVWTIAWYTDPDDWQALSHYIFLIGSFLELINFISIIAPISQWKSYLSPTFKEIPDFQIEKYLEKYVPHWLDK